MHPEFPSPPEPLPPEQVFLPDEEPPVPNPVRYPGPGVLESIGWLAGIFAVQVGAMAVGAVGLGFLYLMTHPAGGALGGKPQPLVDVLRDAAQYVQGNLAPIFAFSGLALVLYGGAAVAFRLRRQGGLRALGLQLPPVGHLALVVLAVIPLNLLGSELQSTIFRLIPQSKTDMEQVFQELAGSSFPLLLWAIAVAPGLGEELIFRGLIGRGLTARFGLVWGVLCTSLLFGIMHINPGQAIGVIPLGIAMHFVYIATRSFWAPVLLHVLNNGLAVVLLKYADELVRQKDLAGLPFLDDGAPTSLPLLTTSAAMLTAIAMLLWQTRVEFARADGTISPSFCPNAESGDQGLVSVRQRPQPLLLACGAFNSAGFLAVLWQGG